MEPEDSLPHSQVPATCPYPEPARSSPYPYIPLLKIHLNIILPSTPGSRKWSLSLIFPHQNPVYPSPLSHTRYMPLPSHSYRFDYPNNTGRGVEIIKLLIMQLPPLPCSSPLLDPDILHNTLFSNILSLRPSINVGDQVSHPYKTTGRIIVLGWRLLYIKRK